MRLPSKRTRLIIYWISLFSLAWILVYLGINFTGTFFQVLRTIGLMFWKIMATVMLLCSLLINTHPGTGSEPLSKGSSTNSTLRR